MSNYFGEFDDIYIIHRLKEYVHLINTLMLDYYRMGKKNDNKQIREKYIFRGFSDVNQMKSKISRQFSEKESDEFELIKKFEENGSLKLGQFNNPIDLVSAAQHYGVCTRLIDWSYSPLIATLFALYPNNLKEEHDYYGLTFTKVNDNLVLESLIENEELLSCSMSRRYLGMIQKLEELIYLRDEIFCYKT